jgi:hypothetical protein
MSTAHLDCKISCCECRQKCFKYLTFRSVSILQPMNKALYYNVKGLRSETSHKMWNVNPSLPHARRCAEIRKVKKIKHTVITNMTDAHSQRSSSHWPLVSHWTALSSNPDQFMWVLWWTKDTEAGFPPSTSVSSCQHHSIDIPYSFI